MSSTTVAEAPFNDSKADFILITSDDVVFYVHRILLALTSPIFESMLSLPPDVPQEKYDERPCVHLDDEAEELYLLLSWCDQRCTQRSTSLDDLQIVLELADKYSMESIIAHAGDAILKTKNIIVDQPLRVFCIAARFELRSLAHAAAIESLKVPVMEWTEFPEMDQIAASTLLRLIRYHKACVDEVRKLANSLGTIWDSILAPRSMQCNGPGCGTTYADGRYLKRWYVDYMKRAEGALEKRPSATTLNTTFLLEFLDANKMLGCKACRTAIPLHIVVVQQYLIGKIEQKIRQVKPSFEF